MYQAEPPLEFIPPASNPLLLRFVHLFLPNWIRRKTPISRIEADNVEVLKVRFGLILAFRHPQSASTLCLGYLFSQLLLKVAQEQKIDLNNLIHVHFIYDRGILLWAGQHIGWIASNLGGTPIQLGKADWMELRSALDLYISGKFPMAATPSGATNGLSEIELSVH